MKLQLTKPKIHHLKVKNSDTGAVMNTTIELDGKKVMAREVEYYMCADMAFPEIKLNILGTADIDINSPDIKIDISPINLKDAFVILQKELLKHETLYDAFVASVMSIVLEETHIPDYMSRDEFKIKAYAMCEKIIKRLIGEE